jgi:hypothetical protein
VKRRARSLLVAAACLAYVVAVLCLAGQRQAERRRVHPDGVQVYRVFMPLAASNEPSFPFRQSFLCPGDERGPSAWQRVDKAPPGWAGRMVGRYRPLAMRR